MADPSVAPPLHVPSLVWFCIKVLSPHPDQVHLLDGVRLNYRRELNDIDLLNLDPRLWATLIQLYDNLPQKLSSCKICLDDPHMPLLQDIPCTASFSLVTILVLGSCKALDDQSIINLKLLHSLVALDASATALSSHGIQRLADMLLVREESDEHAPRQHIGPWPLRLLSLRGCTGVKVDVYPHLTKFPLLSIVDLRNTGCRRAAPLPSGFKSRGDAELFHPTSLKDSLDNLHKAQPKLQSSRNAYFLRIVEWRSKLPPAKPTRSVENSVIVFSPTSSIIKVDNANRIARITEAADDRQRHERNKAAWYERNVFDPPSYATMGRLETPRSSMASSLTNAASPFYNPFKKPPTKRPRAVAPSPSIRLSTKTSKPLTVNGAVPSSVQPPALSTAPTRHLPLVSNKSAPQGMVASNLISVQPIASAQKVTTSIKQSPSTSQFTAFLAENDKHFMFYRDPPPWSALADAINATKEHQVRRKESLRMARATRTADFASVDRDGGRAVLAKAQLGNLMARREQMKNEFALPTVPVSRPLGSVKNPFAKRHSIDSALAIKTPASTNIEAKKPLRPISAVPTPVFTQDLLDTNAKETGSTIPETPPLKRSASTSSLPKAKRQAKDVQGGSTGFDWKKWAKAPP